MMQKGVMIVCGDAADGVADSMYAGTIYLGGRHGELGGDAVFEDLGPDEDHERSPALTLEGPGRRADSASWSPAGGSGISSAATGSSGSRHYNQMFLRNSRTGAGRYLMVD